MHDGHHTPTGHAWSVGVLSIMGMWVWCQEWRHGNDELLLLALGKFADAGA